MPGGKLWIQIDEDWHVMMTGSVQSVCRVEMTEDFLRFEPIGPQVSKKPVNASKRCFPLRGTCVKMNLCKEERIHWQQRERKMQMDERTFRVTVSSQQYHTWQGVLEYENRTYSFLSELDLVKDDG